MNRGMRGAALLPVMLAAILAVMAGPRGAEAWRHGWYGQDSVFHTWAAPPVILSPRPALPFGYRFSLPPGAPLSFDDPATGTTYCLSHISGYYFVCGSAPSAPEPAAPVFVPGAGAPPGVVLPTAPQGATPPSGILVFRLPADAEVQVDDVPVGLSRGLGVTSVSAGTHRVLLRIAGTDAERTVNVVPNRVLTVTPTAIVPTEP